MQEISKKENGNISSKALRIISQVSEGSVRDGVSLLDRAITYQNVNSKNQIDDHDVRNMLGLADKSKIINLLKEVFKGNSKQAIDILNELFSGIEAKYLLNDILEILSLINRKLSLGSIENDKILPEEEINLINEISKGINIDDIGLFWQLTIKTIDDLRIVNDEEITLEMYIMQLLHLKGLRSQTIQESKTSIVKTTDQKKKSYKRKKILNENKNFKIKSQLKSTDQVKTSLIESPKLKDKN